MSTLNKNTVTETVQQIADGSLSCATIVNHYTQAIAQTEKELGAWKYFDPNSAKSQAAQLDATNQSGLPIGSLHGIPVGIKDIFDTADFPTCYGSPIYADHQPKKDSRTIEKLKEAGVVIMGKTETTEFAYLHPSRTINPHNHEYSPGGSSSGSAAAVAAGHVPLAIGSQTGGSVIRPASFCGVYGFKPSRGLMSRRGVLQTSETLDHVGVFANHLEDIAVLADALIGYDSEDSATSTTPKPELLNGYQKHISNPPSIVWIDMPYSDRYTSDANGQFEKLLHSLDGNIQRIKAPSNFEQLLACHKTIYDYEIIRCLGAEISNHWESISETAKSVFETAKGRTESDYREAIETRSTAQQWFAEFFNEYDAILTPSAVSEAPLLSERTTGDAVCCVTWTLCGLPCVNLPLLSGKNDLPIGVQMVGAHNKDDSLMHSAKYLLQQMTPRT